MPRLGVRSAVLGAAVALFAATPVWATVVEVGEGEEEGSYRYEGCAQWSTVNEEANRRSYVTFCFDQYAGGTLVDIARDVFTTVETGNGESTRHDHDHFFGEPETAVVDWDGGIAQFSGSFNDGQCGFGVTFDMSESRTEKTGYDTPYVWFEGEQVRLHTDRISSRSTPATASGSVCGWPEAQDAEYFGAYVNGEQRTQSYQYVGLTPEGDGACLVSPDGTTGVGECAGEA